jgi:chemotaxis protein methyltransferase CheR
LALLPEAAKFDIKILATDINRNVLEAAKVGLYGAAAIAPLEPEARDRYFIPSGHEGGAMWRVGPELRSMVAFRELNLIADWPMRQRYQAIFCRNVAIYFESSIRAAFWDRFASLLAPGGVLYIGHSERITTSRHRFKAEGNTTYRLVQPVTA